MGGDRPVPLISVILPVRNAAKTIEKALLSLHSQIFQEWEAIIIDDGSQDDTPSIVMQWCKKDPRIKFIRQKAQGIVAALNQGIQYAHGPFIARMDADDFSLPERLMLQLDWLLKHPNCGLVSGKVIFGGDPIHAYGYYLHVQWVNKLLNANQIRNARFVDAPVVHPSVMFRRELIEKFGSYKEGFFPEDYELWLRWLEHGVIFEKVPTEILIWTDRVDRLSRVDPRYSDVAIYKLKAKYLALELSRIVGSREIWIWGAGRKSRQRLNYLIKEGVIISGFIDVDPQKIGKKIGKLPVVGMHQIPSPKEAVVLVYAGKRGARNLSSQVLNHRGFIEGNDYFLVS